jgi:3-deoxy-D-manno-octulosonic acid kinase
MVVEQEVNMHGEYRYGCSDALAAIPANQIIAMIGQHEADERQAHVLSGRGFVVRRELAGIGPVVLKQYHRGGIIGRVNPSYYLRLGQARPAHEFDLLRHLRAMHMTVPEPLMWITKGGLIYQGWLLMREIPYVYSLADCGSRSADELEPVLRAFSAQVEQLILSRIYHVDLHPGNVLVSTEGDVSIIDFDKASTFKDSQNKLRDLYLCRWRRAVIKHRLPDFLAEHVCAHLRKNFVLNSAI